jgi:hypothetical protein
MEASDLFRLHSPGLGRHRASLPPRRPGIELVPTKRPLPRGLGRIVNVSQFVGSVLAYGCCFGPRPFPQEWLLSPFLIERSTVLA